MAPSDPPSSQTPQDSYADWDETASGRRPGDDPFLPEEGFFWWLPRAALALVGLALILFVVASVYNHGRYQLIRDSSGAALLQRGAFSPSGWNAHLPDGAALAWAPIPWPADSVEPPMQGEVLDLAESFLGFLRAEAARNIEDDQRLAALEEQEEHFGNWFRSRFEGQDFPHEGSVRDLRAVRDRRRQEAAVEAQAEADRLAAAEASLAEEKAAEAERARLAAELAEATAGDAKSYPARRRELLRDAEALLSSLPEDLGPEQLRDRAAVEQLIDALNTPVGFR